VNIYAGREGFATRGKEQEGRISYEVGIEMALSAFEAVRLTADPFTIILAEYTFISQELKLCPESDVHGRKSLTHAIQSFDDAFLALQVVEVAEDYRKADKTHPHHADYRVKGFPKDSYHVACISHRTRLNNILRSPGIDPIEKELLGYRIDSMTTAQGGYIVKQKQALAG